VSLFGKPKGTIITPFPEWDSGAMAWGGCNTADVPSTGSNVSLYNNATQGLAFFVYLISATSTDFAFLNVFFIKAIGTQLVGPCFPIDAQGAQPFGQIYAENFAIPPPKSSFALIGSTQAQQIGQNWPVAIVRPGYSLVVQSDTGADELSVGFIYRVGAF